MILVQRDRERRVGGEDELGVSLPPIPAVIRSQKNGGRGAGMVT